ncbi:Zinc metalloproteinase nas-14 [Pseudolycoriella hygida]|uniref:Metalloendopeptidase n=1 Tax=Pseudolycoriella hygida TaxID=35572 RepID=A0A9Q0N7K1_9DIPT|nr:Zinc metalloproteinase nas-14 [Pseudolycoriella hygida]
MKSIVAKLFLSIFLLSLVVTSSGVKYWRKGKKGKLVNIPYVISGFNDLQRQTIKEGINEIEKVSCIRFFRRNGQKDYIRFRIAGDGLGSSFLGRKGGEQFVRLNTYGSTHKFRVIHELLHALGFHHTHQRPDRSKFVKIMRQNIKRKNLGAFEKYKGWKDIQGTPYDFESIMHYYGTAFSKNGKPTIVPVDPQWIDKFGRKEQLSEGDILRINRLYKCPGYEKW